MKTLNLLLSIGILTASGAVFAQSGDADNREKMQFGIKAGINYSNVYDSQNEEFNADAKIGLAGGAFLHFPISKYFGVQPEILFSQKGFKGEGMLLGSKYKFTRTTSFIDIPLLAAFKPSEFFTILAGPQYAFLLKQKDEFTSSLTSFSQEQEFKNDNMRKNIFGLVAGVDVNLKHIKVGARLGWDMQNNHGDGTSSTPRYKNTWVQGTLGYTFHHN